VATVRAMHGAPTETLTESDSVIGVKLSTHVGNMTETLTTTPSVAAIQALHAAVSETLTTTPSIIAQKQTNFSVSMSETLTTVADLLKAAGNHADLTETHSITDSCDVSRCNPRGIIEGFVTTDSLKIIKSQIYLTESLTTAPTVTAQRAGINSIALTETLTAIPAVGASFGHSVAMAETLTTSSSTTGVKSSSSVSMSETLTSTDSIAVTQCIQFPSEQLVVSDFLAVQPAHVANMTDTLFTSDNAAAAVPNRLVLISETQTVNTSVAVTTTHPRSLVENLSHSDSVALQGTYIRGMTDAVVASDLIAASKTNQQQVGNMVDTTPVISDSLSATSLHFANMFENLTESDSVTGGANKQLIETLTVSDVIHWQTGKGATENLTTAATVFVTATHSRAMTDSVSALDLVTVSKTGQVIVNVVEFQNVFESIHTDGGHFLRKRFILVEAP
jgi:hypothetical protein